MKKRIIAISVVMLMTVSMMAMLPTDAAEPQQPEPTVAINPFRCDGNAQLGGAADSGTGTYADPWIIENKEIDCFGYNYGIYIGNTTEHFTIRNCTINGTTVAWDFPYYVSAGIHLYNTDHGNVTNNSIYDCLTYGINVSNTSYNVTVYDNTLWANIGRGVAITFSDYINTTYNTIYCNETTNHAITMDGYSDYQTIIGNRIVEPVIIGIGFNDSWNVTIMDNIITGFLTVTPDVVGGPLWGIYVHYSYWVDIENNTLTDCINGIFVTGAHGEESHHNKIHYNTLNGCWATGIAVSYSVNLTIYKNSLDNTNPETEGGADYGILIFHWVNETLVKSNTITHYGTGINITTANNFDVTIWNNTLTSNTLNAWDNNTATNVQWYYGIRGNWWSDWTVPPQADVNNDGNIDAQRDIPGAGSNYDLYPRCIATIPDPSSGGTGGGTVYSTWTIRVYSFIGDVQTPIVGASIETDGATTVVTNSQGVYIFTSITDGAHSIVITANGFTPETRTHTFTPGEELSTVISMTSTDDGGGGLFDVCWGAVAVIGTSFGTALGMIFMIGAANIRKGEKA